MASDEDLMVSYSGGDLSAFDELYRRYHGRVYGYLIKRMKGPMAEEVFQNVFLKLHQKKHLYRRDYPLAPWFFTLVRHTMIDHYRRQGQELAELPQDLAAPTVELAEGTIESLGLAPDQLELLYLKFVEGHQYQELAAKLGKSSSSLRKQVSRLVEKLRGKFDAR